MPSRIYSSEQIKKSPKEMEAAEALLMLSQGIGTETPSTDDSELIEAATILMQLRNGTQAHNSKGSSTVGENATSKK